MRGLLIVCAIIVGRNVMYTRLKDRGATLNTLETGEWTLREIRAADLDSMVKHRQVMLQAMVIQSILQKKGRHRMKQVSCYQLVLLSMSYH